MASVELELQGAIVTRLKADATLTTLVGGRVYDQPPTPVTFPYVTIGEAQTLRDEMTCVSARTIYLTMHAWSQKTGFPEVRQIAEAVAESLHWAPLTLSTNGVTTNRLISLNHRQIRVFRDDDGLTSHAVIEFVAYVERPAA